MPGIRWVVAVLWFPHGQAKSHFFPPKLCCSSPWPARPGTSHTWIFSIRAYFCFSFPSSFPQESCNLPYRSESQLWGRLVIFQRVSVSQFKTGSCLYWSSAAQLHIPAFHARFSRITKERGWSGSPVKKRGGSSMKSKTWTFQVYQAFYNNFLS